MTITRRQLSIFRYRKQILAGNNWCFYVGRGITSSNAQGKYAKSYQWKPIAKQQKVKFSEINSTAKFARWFLNNITDKDGVYLLCYVGGSITTLAVAIIYVTKGKIDFKHKTKSILYKWLVKQDELRNRNQKDKKMFI
jgi:hypothetical protein